MKITIDTALVRECSVNVCAYNVGRDCRACAITVGDGAHPGCDTFLAALRHTRNDQTRAGVGACKVTGCQHNQDFACSAATINVGHSGRRVSCLTYAAR